STDSTDDVNVIISQHTRTATTAAGQQTSSTHNETTAVASSVVATSTFPATDAGTSSPTSAVGTMMSTTAAPLSTTAAQATTIILTRAVEIKMTVPDGTDISDLAKNASILAALKQTFADHLSVPVANVVDMKVTVEEDSSSTTGAAFLNLGRRAEGTTSTLQSAKSSTHRKKRGTPVSMNIQVSVAVPAANATAANAAWPVGSVPASLASSLASNIASAVPGVTVDTSSVAGVTVADDSSTTTSAGPVVTTAQPEVTSTAKPKSAIPLVPLISGDGDLSLRLSTGYACPSATDAAYFARRGPCTGRPRGSMDTGLPGDAAGAVVSRYFCEEACLRSDDCTAFSLDLTAYFAGNGSVQDRDSLCCTLHANCTQPTYGKKSDSEALYLLLGERIRPADLSNGVNISSGNQTQASRVMSNADADVLPESSSSGSGAETYLLLQERAQLDGASRRVLLDESSSRGTSGTRSSRTGLGGELEQLLPAPRGNEKDVVPLNRPTVASIASRAARNSVADSKNRTSPRGSSSCPDCSPPLLAADVDEQHRRTTRSTQNRSITVAHVKSESTGGTSMSLLEHHMMRGIFYFSTEKGGTVAAPQYFRIDLRGDGVSYRLVRRIRLFDLPQAAVAPHLDDPGTRIILLSGGNGDDSQMEEVVWPIGTGGGISNTGTDILLRPARQIWGIEVRSTTGKVAIRGLHVDASSAGLVTAAAQAEFD
ncbi:unnamed protein product, partial [Amoebophrya sp. A25]